LINCGGPIGSGGKALPGETRDLGRQRGDFAPNVRIIGRFNKPAVDPPVPTDPDGSANKRGAGGS
jgi:hypothetical protein